MTNPLETGHISEQPTVKDLLTNPKKLASFPILSSVRYKLEQPEWDEARNLMSTVGRLVRHSEELQNDNSSEGYDFDMGIWYAHMYAYQCTEDPNVSCVIRAHPSPFLLEDVKHSTRGMILAPERVEKY